MNGYQVAQRIRAAGGAMRIVALTGYGQEEDYQRSREAGIDLHLVKPADHDQLRLLLRRFHALLGDE